ncbi:MAG: pitrilysin family protein [Candidatus Aminicenantes bacterium]|nr:pitrilysin family protein [Candidatus Aminicenantes bacterium]
MKKNRVILGFILLAVALSLAGQERFRKAPPPPEPRQELKLPSIETSPPLTNGLRVSVIFRDDLPMMILQLIIQGGESSSPERSAGTASFAAHVVTRSTQSRSASDIEEFIESIGGSLSVSTMEDFTLLTFRFLDDYLDQALELLGQMILKPDFSEKAIKSVKSILTLDYLGREKNPEFVAYRHLIRLLFKNHPYEKMGFPREAITNWNQKDLLEFFDRYYRPNNAHLILTGSIPMRMATQKVSRVLNTWQRAELSQKSFPPITPPLLGGTMNSRLFMNLRESKGYAYFAFSQAEFSRSGGLFFVRAKVAPEFIYPSVQEILKEIRKITREPIAISEIDQAKSYLIGNFPVSIEQLGVFSEKISEIMAYDRGNDYWNKYYEQILLVSPEKVFTAAQKCFLQPPLVVIAGDKSVLTDRLNEFESIDVYDSKGIRQYTINKEKQ